MSTELVPGDEDPTGYYLRRLELNKQARIKRMVNRIESGIYSLAPIMCTGPKRCPFIKHCPIPEVDVEGKVDFGPDSDYPIDQPCIMEHLYFQQKVASYISYLKIDQQNPIEMSIANELASIDLYKNRATMILSTGDKEGNGIDFLQVDKNFIDTGNGNEKLIIQQTTQLHPAFEVIDRLEKRREKIIDKLVESRRGKMEIAIKLGKQVEETKLMKELAAVKQLLLERSTQTILIPENECLTVKG